MNKKTNDAIVEGSFGRLKEVDNFLPSPEKLVFKKLKTVRVTMELDKDSVDYFKQEAKRLGGSYQRMIRNLVKDYARHHKNA